MSLTRARRALLMIALSLGLSSTAIAAPADQPAPRAPQCAKPMLAALQSARESERRLSPSLSPELALPLRSALDSMGKIQWAKASVEEALDAGIAADTLKAHLHNAGALRRQAEASLRQARLQARASGDHAKLAQVAAAERELERSQQTALIHAGLAEAANDFSRCVAPRRARG